MIKRLLILLLICSGVLLAADAWPSQPGQISFFPYTHDTTVRDTTRPAAPDTTHRDSTLRRAPPDTLRRDSASHQPVDTAHHDSAVHVDFRPARIVIRTTDTLVLPDSLRRLSDSVRRVYDSLQKADTVLSARALLHQIDSLNASPAGSADSLKTQLDAQLSAARANAATGVNQGVPTARQSQSPGYSPSMGTAGSSGGGAPTTKGRPAAPADRRNARNSPPVLSNLHRKYIPVSGGKISLDSLSIIPGSAFIKDVPDSDYLLDWVNATLVWRHPPPTQDSVMIYYRAFPNRMNAVARRFNYDSIQNYFLVRPYEKQQQGQNVDNFFNFGNISYNGSFGRSISFGNSQDAVVTSNLNLQISGYLADSIEISAAITDNNIPIQPDGTTADLNEFDKIFLQFKKKNWALTMGDIDLRQNQMYFLNFYKRLEGASFETTTPLGDKGSNKTLVSAAIAKGKFTRNIFEGQEGNQGPYKLQGANQETYFIVLAGTEKVYIDGILMQRGENADYTINYNTAEVTFTANRMITQDVRIQVEFEYADRNYLNVNLYAFDEAAFNDKLKVRVGLFSNSDSRNSPIDQSLTTDETKFLSKLGDSIAHAYYPVAAIDTFAAGKILYRRVDTTYTNAAGVVVHDSAFVFSTDATQTLYNLSFANVGQGYGNYILNLNGVNGNIYTWVAPVNGIMQGTYEAAEFLVTPKTQTIISVGADYKINKNTMITAEVAKSHYDINTLSSIDKANDDGYALKTAFKNVASLDTAKGLKLTTGLGFEYVQKNFNPIERLRSVEFTRDWGLGLYINPADEKLYSASFLLSDKKANSVKYDVSRYERGDGFTGMQNTLVHHQTYKGWTINDQVSLTTSDSNNFSGIYLRPSVDVSKKLSFLKNYMVGVSYSLEHNEQKDKSADTVAAGSYAFHTWTAYLKSPENLPNHWGMSYSTRDNAYANGRNLGLGDKSHTFSLTADFLKNKRHQFHINVSYRQLKIVDSMLTTQTADNSVLGRAEYMVNEWRGLLKGNALYEVGSGQQQKLNFTYLQVPAGTGQYAWIDYNNDGIQQLSEFVLAQFADQAQYIRVYTPSDVYIRTNYVTLNYSVTLTPKTLLSPKSKGLKKLLYRTILQSSLQLTQKQEAQGIIDWNPLGAPLADTALLTQSEVFVNTLSYNRMDPKWGFDLSNTRNSSKNLLTYGLERQQVNEWSLRTRLNWSKALAFSSTIRQGTNLLNNSSSNFDSSNYSLKQFSVEPNLTYTRRSNLRIGLGYKLAYKQNAEEWGGQKYSAGSLNTDFKYNILQSTSIQGKFTLSTISYTAKDGQASTTSAVAYTILEGLSIGKNYLWNIDFTKKLGSSLEISLQYEGRKAGETNVVHTGRASLRALL